MDHLIEQDAFVCAPGEETMFSSSIRAPISSSEFLFTNYLSITPQTLSRIRKDLSEHK